MKAQLYKLVMNTSVLGSYAIIGGTSLFLALVFAILFEKERLSVTQEAAELSRIVTISHIGGALAHQLQKERGKSAVVIASNGENFVAELADQRQKTDQELEALRLGIAELGAEGALLQSANDVLALFQDLPALRAKVDELSVDGQTMLNAYSSKINRLLALYDLSSNSELSSSLKSVGMFLRAKEASGLERAIGASVLTRGGFGSRQYEDYVRQVVSQEVNLDRFNTMSGPLGEGLLSRLSEAPENKKLVTLRTRVLSRNIANFTAADFFAAATARLELLYIYEQELTAGLKDQLDKITQSSRRDLYATLVICIVAFGAVILLSYQFATIQSRVMQQVIDASKKMISGDLTATLPKAGSNGLSEVIRTLAIFRDETRDAREREQANTESERANLKLLRQKSIEAHQRTQRIAADLEHTASSTDELAHSVANSSKSTAEANSHANNMLDRATNGKIVVENAIEAMNRISAVSGQINSIVSIIDEIAFQTNLLALNARVEAARAGPAGRGFAVVASEVQQLAARSARAASDVSGLINESSAEIEKGVGIVQNSGEMLAGIASSAIEIADVIRNLNEISVQQSQALSTINSATTRLDQEMQQLAAGAA